MVTCTQGKHSLALYAGVTRATRCSNDDRLASASLLAEQSGCGCPYALLSCTKAAPGVIRCDVQENRDCQLSQPSVCAIAVTYEPCITVLARLLEAIETQVAEIVIVDNGSTEHVIAWLQQQASTSRIVLVALGTNLGIAAAHNKGIQIAQEKGHSHVLLLDHDSIATPPMVDNLMAASIKLAAEGMAIAAVGPRYYDPSSKHMSSFVRFGWFKFSRAPCPPAGRPSKPLPVDFLISSGSLISIDTLEKVGMMDEGLFIDHVDTEWFLRARAAGYQAFGACDAIMEHSLGIGSMAVWFGRWRHVPKHSPLRHYYIFRNSILLYKRSYAPTKWIIADLVRLAFMLVFYSFVTPPRIQHLGMMLKGIRDGIRNRVGPINLG